MLQKPCAGTTSGDRRRPRRSAASRPPPAERASRAQRRSSWQGVGRRSHGLDQGKRGSQRRNALEEGLEIRLVHGTRPVTRPTLQPLLLDGLLVALGAAYRALPRRPDRLRRVRRVGFRTFPPVVLPADEIAVQWTAPGSLVSRLWSHTLRVPLALSRPACVATTATVPATGHAATKDANSYDVQVSHPGLPSPSSAARRSSPASRWKVLMR